MTEPRSTPDEALIAFAREAADDVAGAGSLGDYVGSVDEGGPGTAGELTAHHFVCLQPGYAGWYWSVSVSDGPTVNWTVLSDAKAVILML